MCTRFVGDLAPKFSDPSLSFSEIDPNLSKVCENETKSIENQIDQAFELEMALNNNERTREFWDKPCK